MDASSQHARVEVTQVRSHRRRDVARAFAWLAGFSATALLVVPKGFSVFAALMLASTFVALPDAWHSRREPMPRVFLGLLWTALAVLGVAACSTWVSGADLSTLDNPSRSLLLPWCAWLAWVTRVRMSCLWSGALVGLLLAFIMSIAQVGWGAARVGAGTNPIVFANAVLVLLVIVVFCRPARITSAVRLLLVLAVSMAVAVVALSGSRGVLPGMGLILLVLLVGGKPPHRWRRLGLVALVSVALLAVLWTVPWLSSRFRLDQVHADVAGYAKGQVDQPISARLGLLDVAWSGFREAPIVGVGIGGFSARVDASRYCRDAPRHFCDLEHAHNDVAQWGATMGLPGVIALLALYLVPLAIARRQVRRSAPDVTRGPGWAAGMLVMMYVLSGLTQSMFSHALTTSMYLVLVGWLLGAATVERTRARRAAIRLSPNLPPDGDRSPRSGR